jgi:conjugation system TraG family ATPase
MSKFSELHPYEILEDGLQLSHNGDISYTYELKLPPVYSLRDNEFDSLIDLWTRALSMLPAGYVVQKLDWFYLAKYSRVEAKGGNELLEISTDMMFYNRPFLNHKCFLTITKSYKPDNQSNITIFNRNGNVPSVLKDRKYVKNLALDCNNFMATILQNNLIEIVNYDHLKGSKLPLNAQTLSQYENDLSLYSHFGNLSFTDRHIANHDYSKEFKVGAKNVAVFPLQDMEDFPTHISTAYRHSKLSTKSSNFHLSSVFPIAMGLNCNHLYSQVFKTVDKENVIKKLQKGINEKSSLAFYSQANALNASTQGAFLKNILEENLQPIQFHGSLIIWENDANRLETNAGLVSTALSEIGFRKVEMRTLNGPGYFWTAMPSNAGYIPDDCFILNYADTLSCFLNFESIYTESTQPVGMRVTDRTGKPLLLDMFVEPMSKGLIANRNGFVIGPSGSGKSFFTNDMVNQLYAQGNYVTVVDVGHSYRNNCAYENGAYITYEKGSNFGFNPFYLNDFTEFQDDEENSIKNTLLTILCSIWRKETDKPTTRTEDVILSAMLKNYYAYAEKIYKSKVDYLLSFDTFYEYVETIFAVEYIQAKDIREQDFDLKNFLLTLTPFKTGGEYGYLLNSKMYGNLYQRKFVVFELDNIKDEQILFSVTTIMIMSQFVRQLYIDPQKFKFLIIEEAWKALMTPVMQGFLKWCYKTLRKHNGSIITVTQELNDLVDNPVVKDTILSNSAIKILLDQKNYDAQMGFVQEMLGLSSSEISLVKSINLNIMKGRVYKEFFISFSSIFCAVYGLEVCPEKYWLYTTNKTEQFELNEIRKKYQCNVREAVQLMVKQRRKPLSLINNE